MEDYNNEHLVNIYNESNTNTEVPFPSDTFADEIFGGFKNEVFYDYLKLFVIILFIIFCVKIFAIFFEK